MEINDTESTLMCDKQKFLLTMKNAGYETEMDGSGVPMVICRTITDMNAAIPAIHKLVKCNQYKGSFGVRGPRKTDIGNITEKMQEEKEAG